MQNLVVDGEKAHADLRHELDSILKKEIKYLIPSLIDKKEPNEIRGQLHGRR